MLELNADPPADCSAGPKGDNLYHWVTTMIGPQGILLYSNPFLTFASSSIENHLTLEYFDELLYTNFRVKGVIFPMEEWD